MKSLPYRRADLTGAPSPNVVSQMLAAHMLGFPCVMLDPFWPEGRRAAALAALPKETPVEAGREPIFHVGFTSGSSGPPKAYARREESWLESFALDGALFALSEDDVFAAPGVFSHSLPLYGVLRALYEGAEALIATQFSAIEFAQRMAARRATVLTATPSQILLIARAAAARRIDFPAVRLVLSGGAALGPEAAAEITAAFPSAEIRPYYGASELSYVAIASAGTPPGSVGRPPPGIIVSIVDERGTALRSGEIGRISVETPLAAAGYLTPRKISPLPRVGKGVCLGDLGRMDENGFLYVEGRADRMLIVAGRNIAPERIEAALEAHPAIVAAAALGQTDELRGVRLAGAVALKRPVSASELSAYCRQRLGAVEAPSRFYQVEDWPRLSSGKTNFVELEARLRAGDLERLA